MGNWLKRRLEIIRLALGDSRWFPLLALFQGLVFLLRWIPPVPGTEFLIRVPWYAWAIGWLFLLWISTLEYSLERKGRFDFTSMNFFKSYLDFILNQGGALLAQSESPDFYAKVSEWQRQVVEGIAIGLGPAESEKFFQKMDGQFPLGEAYRRFKETGSPEALCLALEENLRELRVLRLRLTGPEKQEMEILASGAESSDGRKVRPVKQIGGSERSRV